MFQATSLQTHHSRTRQRQHAGRKCGGRESANGLEQKGRQIGGRGGQSRAAYIPVRPRTASRPSIEDQVGPRAFSRCQRQGTGEGRESSSALSSYVDEGGRQ